MKSFVSKLPTFKFWQSTDTLFHIPYWVLSWIRQFTAIRSKRFRMNTWPRIIKSSKITKQKSKNEQKQTAGVKKSRTGSSSRISRRGIVREMTLWNKNMYLVGVVVKQGLWFWGIRSSYFKFLRQSAHNLNFGFKLTTILLRVWQNPGWNQNIFNKGQF